MPVTPFHFGPGLAVHALAPQRISFLAFVGANVLTDVEPLYYMVTGQFPLHRVLHTVLGATLTALTTLLLFLGARRWLPLPNPWGWKQLPPRAVALGALLGTLSHVGLDAIMHGDVRPLSPFTQANPLYGAVSLATLHLGCLTAGLLGFGLWAWRRNSSAAS